MSFLVNKKNKKKKSPFRTRRADGDGNVVINDFGYSSDVLPKNYGYSNPILYPRDYSYDVPPKDYGYTTPPTLPAPPENCMYVFNDRGEATLKCFDNPIDVYTAPNPVLEPLPTTYASYDFPMWDKLNCGEIKMWVDKLEQELTYIRVTEDMYNQYLKQIEYGKMLYAQKCITPIDTQLGLGSTGGIKTPIDQMPTDTSFPTGTGETPIITGGGGGTPIDQMPVETTTPTGTGETSPSVQSPAYEEPLAPVLSNEAAGNAPFKFQWWWAVAAGVGLYLLTKSNK